MQRLRNANTKQLDKMTTEAPMEQKRLSTLVKVTCIALAVLILIAAAFLPPVAFLILPFLILPTILLFWYHSTLSLLQQVDRERLIWIYIATGVVGTSVVGLIQGVLLIPFVKVAFGKDEDFFWHELQNTTNEKDIIDDDHRAARAAFAARDSYWAFVFFMCFVLAGGLEEMLKYIMIVIGRGKRKNGYGQEYLMYGAAASIGFATFEAIAFLGQAVRKETGGELLLTVVERMGLGLPAHTLAGLLTAAGVAQRDRMEDKIGTVRIVGPSMFLHGLFDFVLLGYSAWCGNIGWIHPRDIGGTMFLLVAVLTIITITAALLKRRMAKIGMP